MSKSQETRIPVSKETHRAARRLKTAGETWDSLIQKMSESYDPEAHRGEGPRGTTE